MGIDNILSLGVLMPHFRMSMCCALRISGGLGACPQGNFFTNGCSENGFEHL